MNISTASTYISAINGNFPLAGQKNDSRGFQHNFLNIKTALTTINASIDQLSTQTIRHFQDNDIGGYNFTNPTLKNSRATAALPGDGTLSIDYNQANYWPITLLNSGSHDLSIVNMPDGNTTGVLTVGISTSTTGTTVTFISDEATVVSLGPENQPFDLGTDTPYFFRLWNDYTGATPYIYVKKINQDIISPVLGPSISSDTLFGNTASLDTVSLGGLLYTNVASVGLMVTDQTHYGNVGLVPRVTVTVATGTNVGIAGGSAQAIGVLDNTGVYPGDNVRFIGTTSQYTVASVVGTLVNLTNPFDVGYTKVNDPITFIGNQFNQPTVATMSQSPAADAYGTLSMGSSFNLRGSVYADQYRLQVAFNDPGHNSPNTFQVDISTTVTNTNSNDIATIDIFHQLLPAGAVIMWTKSKNKIPYGWWLCDGTQAPNGMSTPDLRNQFILGADSDLDALPAVTDPVYFTQTRSGGTSTGVLLSHYHTGTANTFAVSDPGHDHLAVGPNLNSPFPNQQIDSKGPYRQSPEQVGFWGFTTTNTSTASQWLISLENVFNDQQGNTTGQGLGIELETQITIKTTGTSSVHTNIPQYVSMYFIYKWLNSSNG